MKALNYFPLLAIFLWIPGRSQTVGDFRSVQPAAPAFPVYDWKSNTSWETLAVLPNIWQPAVNAPANKNPKKSIQILSYVDLNDDLIIGNDGIILRIGNGDVVTTNNPYKVSDYNILVVRGAFEINNDKPLLAIEENGILVVFGDLTMGNKSLIVNEGILVVGGQIVHKQGSDKATYDEGENGDGLLFLENGEEDTPDSLIKAPAAAYTFDQLCDLEDIDEIANRATDLRRDVLDALCDFMRNGGDFPLPVELLTFDVRVAAPAVELSWSTATELNNDFFTLERSANGIRFDAIATVAGSGTTNETSHYKYTDQSPLLGMAYYRLSQTDYDGTHEVLGVRAVNFLPSETAFSMYPNPLQDGRLTLRAAGIEEGRVAEFSIRDLSGRVVYSFSFNPSQPYLNEELEVGGRLARGFYLAELQQAGRRFTQKLVVD
jgi:hypothetical protein